MLSIMYSYSEALDWIQTQKDIIKKYELKVHPDFWLYSNEELLEMVNGCGPSQVIYSNNFFAKAINVTVSSLVPDKWLGVSQDAACVCHDFGYQIGKTLSDKKRIDDDFKYNMTKMIEIKVHHRIETFIDLKLRDLYYYMVSKYGVSSFEDKNVGITAVNSYF